MGNLVLDNKILNTISSLARQLKTTKEDIVKKAVQNYEKKINQKNRLMEFAGILEEEDANEILSTIYSNRQNKEIESRLDDITQKYTAVSEEDLDINEIYEQREQHHDRGIAFD
jgi:uncharacterized protein YfcZ (UPF0381/DUF406 family)